LSAKCPHAFGLPPTWAREPGGQGGSNDTPAEIYLGGQTWYFDFQIFFWKEIFSGTHPYVATEAASTLWPTVFFVRVSFITDLWTLRNVALVILTPPLQSKK